MILFNMFLLILCMYVGRTVYHDYLAFRDTHQAQTVSNRGEEKQPDLAPRVPLFDPKAVAQLNQVQYLPVSEKNLFLESRSLTKDAASPAAEAPPPLEPRPVLLGIAKVGNDSRALIFHSKPAQGQRASRMVRLGDDVLGYRVAQIASNKVELTYTAPSGTVSTQVLDLSDPASRMMRSPVRTPITENPVINIGSRPQTIPINPAIALQGANMQLRRNEFIDDQGRRIARTPFGDKVIATAEQEAISSASAAAATATTRPANRNPASSQPSRLSGTPYP